MDQQRTPIRLERVAGFDRSSAFAVVVVGMAVLLLVAKPWAGPGPAHPSQSTQGEAPADLSPSLPPGTPVPPSPDAELAAAVARRQCQNPAVWRVVTQERTGSLDTWSLFPINPVPARGPADLSIMAATSHASQLLGIGYCIPAAVDPDISTMERHILLWKKNGAGGYTAVNGTRVLNQALFNLGEAYFGPPIGARDGTWPGGRYVFEIQGSGARGTARWFALEFAPSD